MDAREGTQSARKHEAIVAAATALFLSKGYQATSVGEIAALAKVGKQTVYKHFSDKQRLFSEIIVACHAYGTTLRGFLPRAWDHPVASDGTTRRVGLGGLITSGTRSSMSIDLGVRDGIPGGCRD